MWKIFVIIVRLPITILGVLLLNIVLPIGILFSIGAFLVLLFSSPFWLIAALFNNKPEMLKNFGAEMIKPLIAVFSMYIVSFKCIYKWGFVLDED